MKSIEDKRVDAAWSEGFDKGSKDGADRERRRIRLEQQRGVSLVRAFAGDESLLNESGRALMAEALGVLDAATQVRE